MSQTGGRGRDRHDRKISTCFVDSYEPDESTENVSFMTWLSQQFAAAAEADVAVEYVYMAAPTFYKYLYNNKEFMEQHKERPLVMRRLTARILEDFQVSLGVSVTEYELIARVRQLFADRQAFDGYVGKLWGADVYLEPDFQPIGTVMLTA